MSAHASISHALLGSRVYIFPGARIGQEGFSFATTKTGFLSIPQLGRVIVEDDVEVGANSTIDRGSTRDTIVGAGTRIDNLVQIGHNVQLGRCCVIVAQVGIAGSTILEDFVQVGGQARWRDICISVAAARSALGRRDLGCARRVDPAWKPGTAADGVLSAGRNTEANDAATEIAAWIWFVICGNTCHSVDMIDTSYRVIPRAKHRFDVEMARPGGSPKTIEGFATEHEANAWIVQTQRMIRATNLWGPLHHASPLVAGAAGVAAASI